MSQKRYYYDDETCTYKPETVSAKDIAKRVGISMGLGVIFGGLLFAGYFAFWDDPKMKILKEQNNALLTEINVINTKFAEMDAKVATLHKRDNEFYRSILNAQPIDDGVWNGGTGGANNPAIANHPVVLRQAEATLNDLSYKIDLQNRSYEHLRKALADNQEKLKHIPAIKPVPGNVISGFGVRVHPILRIRKEHTGLDFTAPIGTPVASTADGKVITAGSSSGGYGNQVEIDHGYGLVTKYAHLSEVKVSVGQTVKRGDIIALTGNTGLSSGPHLHYEIVRNDTKIDPVDYFYQDLSPSEYEKFKKEAAAASQTMD